MQLIALGSDPELFLEDKTGKVISAIGKIGGTKKNPRPIKPLGKGFYVQEDNVLLEYNTPIARNAIQWRDYQKTILSYLQEMVGALGLALSQKSSHTMDEDQMTDDRAWVFGCDPDFDVWAKKNNPPPKSPDPLLRSAGGHVHVAYANPNPMHTIMIGRALDYFLGANLATIDPDKRRKELYGRPGAIRFKPYGLEYRTPSNFWTFRERTVNQVYEAVKTALMFAEDYDKHEDYFIGARQYLKGEIDMFDQGLLLTTCGVFRK